MYIELNKIEESALEINNKSDSNYYFDHVKLYSTKETILGSFETINFFIGTNNSGKSRFLRGLLKYDAFNKSITKDKISFEELKRKIEDTYSLLKDAEGVTDNRLKETFNKIEKEYSSLFPRNTFNLNELITNFNSKSEIFNKIFKLLDFLKEYNYSKTKRNDQFYHDLVYTFYEKINVYYELMKFAFSEKIKEKIYIPTLRNLTRNSNFSPITFNNVIKENYNIEKNVFTGLTLYDELSDKKGAPIKERKKVQEFEKFLSITFFENSTVEITANKTNPATILLSIDENEFPIYDIGDGIQMLIILLFPIFTAKDNTWFFIEEPETHLHPGLQRIFIETLLNNEFLKSKNLRYFFTTHSNHFLDLSLQTDDISIFQFQKESQLKFNIKNVKPSKETLDLLGVNNSSVLMANSSIWVEGPTDRKYISKFLKLYCEQNKSQNLKEDIDFAFFEYGGNLIEHYLFDDNFDEIFTENEVREKINSFALSNRIYLLADNDNATGKKLERRESLVELSSKGKNFKYQNTNYREIENLLPVKIIRNFLKELIKVSEIEKINNIKFKREDYISIGLGDFIESLFKKYEITDFKSFRDDSGTLKSTYKTKLCDFVINGNYKYEDLMFENEQLEEIIKNLYSFIRPK